jgi:hypothetical protein
MSEMQKVSFPVFCRAIAAEKSAKNLSSRANHQQAPDAITVQPRNQTPEPAQ